MGTHPIFESDFDCLTENEGTLIKAYTNQMVITNKLWREALKIQTDLVKRHHADPSFENRLLLLEHPPTYTVGKRGAIYDETIEEYLRELGADFYRVNRGGLITFHGPGQLVGYPILRLERRHSTKWYVG